MGMPTERSRDFRASVRRLLGHLRPELPLVVLVSWLIALPEYALQVPANRIGHATMTAAQLKTLQEVISLTVFAVFSRVWLGEHLGWQHAVGFALIVAGAWVVFHRWS